MLCVLPEANRSFKGNFIQVKFYLALFFNLALNNDTILSYQGLARRVADWPRKLSGH